MSIKKAVNKKATQKKFKILRVTMKVDFALPMIDDKRSEINGWVIDEVIKDWFKNEKYPLGAAHATRDRHKIGFSEKLVKVRVKELKGKLIRC